MSRPARLGHDLDAVPVANATERTAPTWEARALAAEARLAALRERIAVALEGCTTGPIGRSTGLRYIRADVAARIAREAQP